MKNYLFYISIAVMLFCVSLVAQTGSDTTASPESLDDNQVPPLEQPVKQENRQQPQSPVQQETQQQSPVPQSTQQQKPQLQNPIQQTTQQQAPVRQQIQQSPLMDERPVTSAPTNVKMTTPLISIDLIMDLYNRDIDFNIEYNGTSGAGISNLGKKRPSEKEVEKMVADQMDTTTRTQTAKGPFKDDEVKPYTPEDANYNKAMISLNKAQQYFSSRRYPEAMAEINRSISFAPNIALSHSVKGSIHYMLRQVAEAKKSWERALELDPTLDNVRAILLRMY